MNQKRNTNPILLAAIFHAVGAVLGMVTTLLSVQTELALASSCQQETEPTIISAPIINTGPMGREVMEELEKAIESGDQKAIEEQFAIMKTEIQYTEK